MSQKEGKLGFLEVGAVVSASLKTEEFDVDKLRGKGSSDDEIILMFAIYDLCFGKVGPKVYGPRIEEMFYRLKDKPDVFAYIEERKAQLEAQRWN